MNYRRAVAVAAIALSMMVIRGTAAQAPQTPQTRNVPLIVGTWKRNYEKSGIRNVSPQVFQIRQYKLRDDGFLVGLLISSNAQGHVSYLQFTARSDGKDYPEYTDDLLAELLATGNPSPRTYAERIVDEHVTEWFDKANGRVTAQGRKTISEDGKTLTITTDGIQAAPQIFERQ